MNSEDRACFNCEGSELLRIPAFDMEKRSFDIGTDMGFSICKQGLSDHYRHLTTLMHVCAWHSDSIKDDERYLNWKETIDEEVKGVEP